MNQSRPKGWRTAKRLLVLLLAAGMTLGGASLPGGAAAQPAADGYTPGSVDNEYYTLDLNGEDGRFTLTDKRGGAAIHSYPDGIEEDTSMKNAGRMRARSALLVTLFDKTTKSTMTLSSLTDAAMEGGLEVKKSDKEWVATYTFAADKVRVPIHYTLDGDRLVVSVLPDEIVEEGNSQVMELSIHPYFYSGNTTEEGYLLVPDGSGALIRFNNQKYTVAPYKQKVYGEDLSNFRYSRSETAAPVLMPLFGIGKKDGMALGIITGGAGDAYVEASPGIGTVSYNGAYATFRLLAQDLLSYPNDNRTDVDIYSDKRNDAKLLQVTYLLRTGGETSYADMAALYRGYLQDTYHLERVKDDAYPLYLDLYMATVRSKSFLGIPYQGVETLTTFRQANDLLESLQKKGIPVVARLNNWSKQTVRGKIPNGASLLSSVGSKKELLQLKATAEKTGALYLNANLSEIYDKGLFSRFTALAKSMNGSAAEYQEFNLVTGFAEKTTHSLLSLKSIARYSKEYGRAVSKLGFQTIGADGLSNLFTDYGADNASLSATANTYEETIGNLRADGFKIALTGGNQFALGGASLILNLPSSDSGFEVCDESVPFYAIALHGYVPFAIEPVNASANPQQAYLQTLETGSGLYFQWMSAQPEKVRYSRNDRLYAANADQWFDSAVEHYAAYASAMAGKQSLLITGHERLAAEVTRTVFEDGSTIVVNYGSSLYEKDGLRVEPLSFVHGKEAA